ncbi:MAG: hypothetical protein A3B11_01415 [Candidatus Taylorbacteria bacterium RIFCSPLOWO2_01_FULL_44_26]|uniref:Thioredoxin domain-containing protein n=2 Tax=Candidatus Tayloriibacteriota TaxID=1817919 RepID=A0A1G2MJW2_9BACT|nr:MAG: hypothetical protein A3D50_01195 [Candidatus Taylorbacteria bacterium RIFCSPHIGHO2_02_FULL_44_12]OHA30973.1 MAG: hypothetical protein A3B11_01415 [Candidatus Taylorbacteria bacterium RIFCSPLOWO2_01_FULL_44_26]
MENTGHSSLTLPGAIVIAGAIIAIAIIWVNKPANIASQDGENIQQTAVSIMPISNADHILGNPNAPIKIVEYSDPSCPFCKMFHTTMLRIINEYGPTGKVAWVYRHFPIDKEGTRPDGGILHPNAGHESQALECAADQGSNDAFWAFANRLYEVTPSVTSQTPNGLDQKELPNIAAFVKLNVVLFNQCLASGKFKAVVEKHYLDGINAGISGTPHSIIITPSGSQIPLVGAQPYETIKAALDALLPEAK